MTAKISRICEWDSEPNERFNYWTIGNVSEVLPGIVKPLIATLMRRPDYLGTKLVAESIDVLDLVPSFEPPVANFIAFFAGRAALNLAWANAIIQTWQTGAGSGLMEQYVTSTEGQDISAGTAADLARAQRIFERIKRTWGQLARTVAADRREAGRLRARELAVDRQRLSAKQLWRRLFRLQGPQLRAFAHHLFVSGAAGEYTSWLSKFLDRVLPGHDPALVIALTSALRGVESARPSMGAWDVAQAIAARPALTASFTSLPVEAIVARLETPPDAGWQFLAQQFGAFLEEYGFRGQSEVDPSAADWAEAPAFALSTIRTFIQTPESRNPYDLEEQAAQQREGLEAMVYEQLPRGERAEFRRLVAGAQKFTRMRESSKANWVRMGRLARPCLLELGRRFTERGLLLDPVDLFFMFEEEVQAAIDGSLAAAEAQERVARRKAEYEELKHLELPEVFTTPAPVSRRAEPAAASGNVLSGMPVSAGQASGRARVVLSAEAAEEATLEPGEILIAPYTDAPWTPLFIPAAGVVVETGGILSHAATVAREFGIPAVVAVKGATRLIHDGQLVTVDGQTGTVTLG